MNWGDKLSVEIEKEGIRKSRLAKLLNIDVRTLHRWLHNVYEPDQATKARISKVMTQLVQAQGAPEASSKQLVELRDHLEGRLSNLETKLDQLLRAVVPDEAQRQSTSKPDETGGVEEQPAITIGRTIRAGHAKKASQQRR